MYPTNTPPSKKPLVISAVIIAVLTIAAWVGIAVFQSHRFRATSTNPSTDQVSTISPFFKVNYNRTLVADGLSVQATPAGSVKSYSVSGETLTITWSGVLKEKQAYTVTVTVRSAKGEQLTNEQFRFTPRFIQSSELPGDQQKAILSQQDPGDKAASEAAQNDPIFSHLPYSTLNFDLTANQLPVSAAQGSKPILFATLNLSVADMADENTAVASYKQQVVDYITSLGLDPNNYNIEYTVSKPN